MRSAFFGSGLANLAAMILGHGNTIMENIYQRADFTPSPSPYGASRRYRQRPRKHTMHSGGELSGFYRRADRGCKYIIKGALP